MNMTIKAQRAFTVVAAGEGFNVGRFAVVMSATLITIARMFKDIQRIQCFKDLLTKSSFQ